MLSGNMVSHVDEEPALSLGVTRILFECFDDFPGFQCKTIVIVKQCLTIIIDIGGRIIIS